MKLAILGDIHVGVKSSSDVMFYHQERFFKSFFEYLDEHDIKTVIQLGDLFDSRKAINLKSLKFVREVLFEPLRERGIEFYTLIGNHDIFYRESLEVNSSGLLLTEFENVHVIEEPTTLTFGSKTCDIVPWLAKSNHDTCVNFIENSTSDYCFGHFEITGYQVLKNVVFEQGLASDLFSHYDRVFSGHFHIRQSRGNVLYCGTPYWLTWNDAGTKKGFHVLDTESGEVEFVENRNNYYFWLTYDDINKKFTDLSNLDLHNAFVKIRLESKTEPFRYAMYVNEIYKQHPYDVKFVEKQEQLLEEAQTTNMVNMDTVSLIKEYINTTEYTNKYELTAFIISLYNEALQREGE